MYIKISLFIFILFLVISCDYRELKKQSVEYQELKSKSLKDSLLLNSFNSELNIIYQALDTASNFDAMLAEAKEIKKSDALYKLHYLDSLLQTRIKIIDSLNIAISGLQSDLAKQLAMSKITEGEKQLNVKSNYYRELQQKITNLESENFSLKQLMQAKDSTIIARNKELAKIQEEQEIQQKKLDDMNVRLLSAEMDLQTTRIETAESYYQHAMDLMQLADKTNSVFSKKKKTELIHLALEYLKKSEKLGYKKATTEIEAIMADKKLNKFVAEND